MEPTSDDVARIIPDLPFSEDEWFEAYRRLYPEAEAREYARRLVNLPRELRAEAREGLKSNPQHPIPLLHVDHDVLAVLATVSADLGRRVEEFMEVRFAEAALNYQHGLHVRRGLPKDSEPSDDVRDEVDRFHQSLKRDWRARVHAARARDEHAPPAER